MSIRVVRQSRADTEARRSAPTEPPPNPPPEYPGEGKRRRRISTKSGWGRGTNGRPPTPVPCQERVRGVCDYRCPAGRPRHNSRPRIVEGQKSRRATTNGPRWFAVSGRCRTASSAARGTSRGRRTHRCGMPTGPKARLGGRRHAGRRARLLPPEKSPCWRGRMSGFAGSVVRVSTPTRGPGAIPDALQAILSDCGFGRKRTTRH